MLFKQRRRRKLRSRPFPDAWRRILERTWPYYRCLSEADRAELHSHVHVFLAEKHFEGAGGLKITEEMRLTIAAQACVLLLRRDTDYYRGLKTILVYPSNYIAPAKMVGPGGVVTERIDSRSGESWNGLMSSAGGGPVVLSWRDVQAGAADSCDGRNVVFHEFAHQLDGESGAVEGAPQLAGRSSYAEWARVLGGEYSRLVNDLRRGNPTVLRAYAATSPAEFFAVVTEVFFERPWELRDRHPELYGQLRDFYRQDPAERYAAAGACPEQGSPG